MFLRKMTLFFFVFSALGLPHDEVSGGMTMAIIVTVCEIGLICFYLADCVEEFIHNRDTSRKVRNYLWLAGPIAFQFIYFSIPYIMAIMIVWAAVLLILLAMKLINIGRGIGNGDKVVDGFFASGVPLG